MAWNAKKTHKIFFSSEQLLPQTSPESDVLGLEYLDTLGPGCPFFRLGRYSTALSTFVVFMLYMLQRRQILNKRQNVEIFLKNGPISQKIKFWKNITKI